MLSVPVTESLRVATRDLHSRIEATPFAKAFLGGALHLDAYVGYLRVMAIIHATLERCLDACDHPLVSHVWSEELYRVPELLEDNEAFRWQLISDVPLAVEAAQKAASHILFKSKDNPVALLGCLYVIGGSTKGAIILSPLVSQTLALSPGRGLSYLCRHGGQGPAEWERAATVLDASTEADQVQSIVKSALVIFQCVLEAFEVLWPLDRTTMRYTVTALNPEGGNHPVPQDKMVLLTVLRASERCLAEFPYFMYRYGQRGRRFADTDGAWLATLPDLGAETMLGQVDWLGRLLSARGMPRLLLVRHMEILAEELTSLGSDHTSRTAMLEDIARGMRQRLESQLTRELRQEHTRRLQESFGRRGDYACAEAVFLLAAAAADEADGLDGSTQSLLSFLADPARFPQPWVEAMNVTLTELRQALGSSESK